VRLALILGTLAAAHALLYYLGRTWGSTPAERGELLPGDDLVPNASWIMDHGVSIEAGAERAWPWLVQVGWGRAGWYTYRWVDKLLFPRNAPSAREVLPQFQTLQLGDRVPDGPPESGCYFVVEAIQPQRHIVLHSTTHLPPQLLGKPGVALDWSWTFTLRPEGPNQTRFHIRVRGTVRPWWLQLLAHTFIVPADFLMGRSMCKGIKQRVEAVPMSG
jgi:hypothetical protein